MNRSIVQLKKDNFPTVQDGRVIVFNECGTFWMMKEKNSYKNLFFQNGEDEFDDKIHYPFKKKSDIGYFVNVLAQMNGLNVEKSDYFSSLNQVIIAYRFFKW